MASTGFSPSPLWHWPQDVPSAPSNPDNYTSSTMPGGFGDDSNAFSERHYRGNSNPIPTGTSVPKPTPTSAPKTTPKPEKHWPPRTCRICLETVMPTFHMPSESLPGILQSAPSVTYDSSDPESGRLLRPCKCKGSSKYVHEGCLQSWRHADPGYAKRNYWHCPTCGFQYRLERMNWGRWISSTTTQILLTIAILFLTMFIMGFVADPIINIYLDPYSFLSSASIKNLGTKLEPLLTDDEVPTWTEHFIKGLASLGLLSFVKFIFALSPWQWWNLRSSGIMNSSGRAGTNGRDRLASISWIMVLVGVGTFLWVSHDIRGFQIIHSPCAGSIQRSSCLESPNVRKGGRTSHGCSR